MKSHDLAPLEKYLGTGEDAARSVADRVGAFLVAVRAFRGVPIPKLVMMHVAATAATAFQFGGDLAAGLDMEELAKAAELASSPRVAALFRMLKAK